MAVAERGHVQQAWNSTGSASLAWPSGTAAGDFALVECDHSTNSSDDGPDATGWAYEGTKVWSKRLTSSDIAGALSVTGKLTSLLVVTGCGGVGSTSQTYRVYADDTGGAAFFRGWTDPYRDTIAGSTGRLGTATESPVDDHDHAVYLITGTAAGYRSLSSPSSRASFRGWELWPAAGPDVPTLIAPEAASEHDQAAAIALSWVHNSTSGSTQEQVKIRIRAVGAGTWSYLDAAGGVTVTETALTQSAETKDVAAAELTADQAYEWTVSTYDQGTWSDYAAAQQFTPRAAPTVDSITVTAPAEDLTPDVAWTETLGVGSQVAYRVRVATQNTDPEAYVYDSGVQVGTDLSWTVPIPGQSGWADGEGWTNGASRYAWVQVQQTGGLWSAWTVDDVTFAVTWTAPDAPSSVTPVNQASGPLQVTVAGIDTGSDVVEIEWSEDGSTWAQIIATAYTAASMVFDVPLAPYGVTVTYRARSYELVDGVALYSAYATSSAVASTDTAAYLVAADDATDYLAVTVADDSSRRLVQGVSVSYGLGATVARVDRGVTQGMAGVTVLRTATEAARSTLLTWLTGRDSWWLRWSPEGLPGALVDTSATRMALASGTSWDRLAATLAHRHVSFSWVEV